MKTLFCTVLLLATSLWGQIRVATSIHIGQYRMTWKTTALVGILCCALGLLPMRLRGSGFQAAHIPNDVKAHHQKLYDSYYHGKNIFDETKAGHDVDITAQRFVDSMVSPEALKTPKNAYPHPVLRGISCDADAVMVAVPKSSETEVTASENFLYTDYRFQVDSILKNSTPMQLGSNTEIIVTRPGGEITANGHIVRARVAGFSQFTIEKPYLLFLEYLPATRTFQAFSVGTFELSRGAVVPMDTEVFASVRSTRDQNAFLTEVGAAVAEPCTVQFWPILGKTKTN